MITCQPTRIRRKKLFQQYLADRRKVDAKVYKLEIKQGKGTLTEKEKLLLYKLRYKLKLIEGRFWTEEFHRQGIYPAANKCKPHCPYYEECSREMDVKFHRLLVPEDKPGMPHTLRERKLWYKLRKEHGLQKGREMYFRMAAQANTKYQDIFGKLTKKNTQWFLNQRFR